MALFLSLFRSHGCIRKEENMKSIGKILIIAGTGLLFLICILIGVLYYRNLNRNEEEMAVSIERNLKEYLNERVNELNPQFLEKEENVEKLDLLSEQILKEISKKLNKENMTWEELFQYFTEEQMQEAIDYVVNNLKSDWFSQFITEAGDVFISEEEYELMGDEIFTALQEKLLMQLEEMTGAERDKLLAMIEEFKKEGNEQIVDLKALFLKLQEENNDGLQEIKTGMQNTIQLLAERVTAAEKEIVLLKNDETVKKLEKDVIEIKDNMQSGMTEVKNSLDILKGSVDTNTSEIDTLKTDVESCFQYVSDGKALLASTITDLGVETAADATFQTIDSNIKQLMNDKYSEGYEAGMAKALSEVKITAYVEQNFISGHAVTHVLDDSRNANMAGTTLTLNLVRNQPQRLNFSAYGYHSDNRSLPVNSEVQVVFTLQ